MLKFEQLEIPGSNPRRTAMDELTTLNATIRFSPRAAKLERQKDGNFDTIEPGVQVAEVVDLMTGKIYAEGRAETVEEATLNALANARTATKPLTLAQQSDPNFMDTQNELAKARARIAELEAQQNKQSIRRPQAAST